MVDRRQKYQEFQAVFPKEHLAEMTLSQYTNLERKNSFCYWVESKTYSLGSIWGGSSYKFGIYEYKNKPNENDSHITSDDKYAWYRKYGKATAGEVFAIVKNAIIKIAEHASKGELDDIDKIDEFGDVYKWKIAFLYSNEMLIPIYKKKLLVKLADHLGMPDANDANIPDLQKFLMKQKGSKDLFEFYEELLNIIEKLVSKDVQKKLPNMMKYPYHVATLEKQIKDKSQKQYWWLVSSPKIWSISKMPVGEVQSYTLYNDNGNQRRIYQNFIDANDGDIIIGYEATPVKQIVAIAEVAKAADNQQIYFRKVEALLNPIDYSTIKEMPELSGMEFFKNMNGSFFKLSESEYNLLLDLIRDENPKMTDKPNPKYPEKKFLDDVFMQSEEYNRLKKLLLAKKNIILQGAPGVGKTYSAKRLAYSIMGEEDNSKIEFVQFHQNYSYEDFIMGYKPKEDGGFELKRGVFYNFCKKAQSDPDKAYFFIIDEINRGNMSKIFGELLMLIENNYRGEKHEIRLAYNDEHFFVPENLYIIGMMNTADRSLAMIDYALRRRFSFFDMVPGFDTAGFKKYQEGLDWETFNNVINAVKALNTEIVKDDSLGQGFCIGHSYFCNTKTADNIWLENVIKYDIAPMLREYWFDNGWKFKGEIQKLLDLIK